MPKKKSKKKNTQPVSQSSKKKEQPKKVVDPRVAKVQNLEFSNNPYVTSVSKKLRNINKRLGRLKVLEEKKPSELNDDQRKSLKDKPFLEKLLVECTNLQTQLKLIALQEEEATGNVAVDQGETEVEKLQTPSQDPVAELITFLHVCSAWKKGQGKTVIETDGSNFEGIYNFAHTLQGTQNLCKSRVETLKVAIERANNMVNKSNDTVCETKMTYGDLSKIIANTKLENEEQ